MANNWQEDELLLRLHVYCRTPFGKLHHTNPHIIQLAAIVFRTLSAVAMKAHNVATQYSRINQFTQIGLIYVFKMLHLTTWCYPVYKRLNELSSPNNAICGLNRMSGDKRRVGFVPKAEVQKRYIFILFRFRN